MLAVQKFIRNPFAIAVTLATGWCSSAGAFETGPPPGHTGIQGEADCTDCHFGNDANTGGGFIKLDGVPASYIPGKDYSISVVLRDDALPSGGFQLTIQDVNGDSGGKLQALQDDVKTIHVSEINHRYIQHNKPRKKRDDDADIQWTVVWTAPDGVRDLIVGAAAVAANDDASALGDYVYTQTARIRPCEAKSLREERRIE
jgi:hypothetical protein